MGAAARPPILARPAMSETPPATPWRVRLIVTALLPALLSAPACGRVGRHLFGGGAATRAGTLAVSPPKGPVGTPFSLAAGGFRPGEPMTFEVDPPNKKRFIGPSHTAGPDGKVVSTYIPQPGAPPGTYLVRAVGSRGTRAQAHLAVTG